MTARQRGYRVVSVSWNSPEAAIVRQIRFKVFVDEQKVPAEEELDDFDPVAYHALAINADGEPAGTGRLYADPADSNCARIGRMAVLAEARGSGCGSALLVALIAEARRKGYKVAVLSAQEHAVPFYERHGFTADGPRFIEAGIPHFRMVSRL